MNIGITDPFSRQRIRNLNQNDKILKKKYFSENFDLKKFIKVLLENYFPNVGWRWIGAGHHAHVKTLELIVYTLEIGLWKASEVSGLLRDIYIKADILHKLEGFCAKDATRLSDQFVSEMVAQLGYCRQHISFILTQCLTLVNDYAVISSMPFIDYNLGEFLVDEDRQCDEKTKGKEDFNKEMILKHLFVRKNNLMHLLSDILINY
jgi:hypothetical protein